MGMTWTKAIGCRKHSGVTIQTECADGLWQREKKKCGTLTGPIPVPPVLFHPLRKHKSSLCGYIKAQEKG